MIVNSLLLFFLNLTSLTPSESEFKIMQVYIELNLYEPDQGLKSDIFIILTITDNITLLLMFDVVSAIF